LRSQGKGKRRGQECREAARDGKISDKQGTWGEKGMVILYYLIIGAVSSTLFALDCKAGGWSGARGLAGD